MSILIGNNDATFSPAARVVTSAHSSPVVADANGDGTPDVMVLDSAGRILFRAGIPGQPGTYAPPVTVNPLAPSRDITWIPYTDQGPILASVDARDDKVSLFAWRGGRFVLMGSLVTGRLPAQIIAADLNGDGRTDLVVRNASDGTLSVYFGATYFGTFVGPINPATIAPRFSAPLILPIGLEVADVRAIDTTGSGRLDLVLTSQLSGQLSVLRNTGTRSFKPPESYRAGTGLSVIDTSSGTARVTTLEATAGLSGGPLTPGAPDSLVTVNPGSNSLGVLKGLGGGSFANPVTIPISSAAQLVRMADLNHDGVADLILLGPSGLSVMLGDGNGGFKPPAGYSAGFEPSGVTVADITGRGIPDLLVSNPYGDLLVLVGNGDGTFRPYRKADQTVTLAVADLTGSGKPDFIYADAGLDRVVVQYGDDRTNVLGDRSSGLLSPGAVKLADLNGDGIPDLIVANSGSNNVLVYPGLGNGQFGPALNGGRGYYTGTNPTGFAVANLNGQPDLVVANSGSNDVSILLGQGKGSNFTLTAGPASRPTPVRWPSRWGISSTPAGPT